MPNNPYSIQGRKDRSLSVRSIAKSHSVPGHVPSCFSRKFNVVNNFSLTVIYYGLTSLLHNKLGNIAITTNTHEKPGKEAREWELQEGASINKTKKEKAGAICLFSSIQHVRLE